MTQTWHIRNDYPANLIHAHGCVLMLMDREIEFFGDEKHAGAWMQHIYGVRPRSQEARTMGLDIKPIKSRGPKAGDAVTYRGGGDQDYLVKEREEVHGILDHSYGADSFGICFDASTYREWDHVSCSGGPIPYTTPERLTFLGLKPTTFWRWHDGYPGAGQAGHYTITVPHWLWDGEKA